MPLKSRLRAAIQAAGIHFLCSLLVAALAAGLVFGLWYPSPYAALAGGRDLFLLIVSVDVVCGPLLTLVIFNPAKPRGELFRDICLVTLIQASALGYGLWSVWQARPLFLVQEVDRFKVIAATDLELGATDVLTETLKPNSLSGPKTVAVRKPHSIEEKNKIMFDVFQGGKDYAERPDFYMPYEGDAALKALQRAKPLVTFIQKYPENKAEAQKIASKVGKTTDQLVYLPVVARQDWIAILDDKAMVIGFLKGDGF